MSGGRSFRRLLVAGAAGFIGSNFVRLLRQTRPEIEITVLDKLTYAGNPANLREFEGQPGYRFVQGDICDRELVDGLAAGVDAIVNFAAETHVDRSLMDPFAFIQTDVLGTAVLCEAARRHAHQVFLLVSTDEVYGEVLEGRSREDENYYHFRCPHCKRRLRFLAKQVGHKGKCSNCGCDVLFPPVSQSVD